MNVPEIAVKLGAAVVAVALVLQAPAHANELHLILNVNDDEDHYPADAAKAFEDALDGVKPAAIDSGAESYFVQLGEGSGIESLGLPVKGEEESTHVVSSSAASAAAVAPEAAIGDPDEGDTGWIELDAYSAAVYYWSEIGEGETHWNQNNPRIFIRRFADGKVVVKIGDEDMAMPGEPAEED